MRIQQKFRTAEQFNRPDTIIIIASYPARKNRSIAKIDAVASYTDHFARSFRKVAAAHNTRVVVLAQKIDGEEWYKEGDILVCRVWDKGSPLCFGQILTALSFFPQVKSVLIQFEFHQFGGKLATAMFPLFLVGLRLLGKSITLVLHQVVENIATLWGHLNIQPHSIKTAIFNVMLHLFYQSSTKTANATIVHSEILAKRLEKITGKHDAIVIPHGLGAIRPTYSKRQARKILGYKKRDYVILSFGFLTWYKGSDWITDTVAKTRRKNVKLLLAGGTSPNIQTAKHYQRFVDHIQESAKSHPNIRLTGFVEDSEIPLYFAAADLVALPYRSLMSSSGPLAMTIAFKKPFLLSKILTPYTRDTDFSKTLRETGLTVSDISFSLHQKDFWNKVTAVKRHPKRFKKASALLRTQRLWPTVAGRFYDVVKNVGLEPAGKFAILEGSTTTYART